MAAASRSSGVNAALEASAPPSFLCPIGREMMRDPVSCTDGHSYERSNIERWLSNSRLSPVTGAALPSARLVPNHALRNAIEEWVVQQQQQPPPPPSEVPPEEAHLQLEVGQAVIYTKSEDGTSQGARVLFVHREVAGPPFYTIALLPAGDERQTEASRLRVPRSEGADLALFEGVPEVQDAATAAASAAARRDAEERLREEAVQRSRQEAAAARQARASAQELHAAAVREAERQEAEEAQAQRAAREEEDAREAAVLRSRREAEAMRARARQRAAGEAPQWDPAASWREGIAAAERATAGMSLGLGQLYEGAAGKLEEMAAGLRQAADAVTGAPPDAAPPGSEPGRPRHHASPAAPWF